MGRLWQREGPRALQIWWEIAGRTFRVTSASLDRDGGRVERRGNGADLQFGERATGFAQAQRQFQILSVPA